MARCEDCGARMEDDTMDYLTEGFETFGVIVCDECFEVRREEVSQDQE